MSRRPLDTVESVRAEVRRVDAAWPTEIHQLLSLLRPDRARLRDGSDDAAADLALVFLEADAVGFGSGYIAETLMHRLAHAHLDGDRRRRAAAVVLHRVHRPRTRLLRPAARLAAGVWDDDLARATRRPRDRCDLGIARRASWLRDHAAQCRRSWAGAHGSRPRS